MEKKTIAGILTLVIVLSTGTTLFIEDLGEKTGCRRGWEYVGSGEYEGYFVCKTSSSSRYEICHDVYNSSNTENYWCRKGVLVKPKDDGIIRDYPTSGDWLCSPDGCTPIK
ncbi:unnamed protein product [marine sediment metagenome]|uniref:Uncharacterized protein n=1 Tax=marine sediment metagenome TaxID=412755 RepID=X1BVV2_9ZZZZ